MDDASRAEAKLPRIHEIPLDQIDDFPDHPFKVKLDEDMDQLVQSVIDRGVITPITLRPKEDGRYEIVAGHRRRKACEIAGLPTVKAEIRDLTRDEAIILMVESNLQRSTILPSEKAFSYKMRLEAMKRQAGRRSKSNFGPVGQNSRNELATETNESSRQIQRYIRLTNLIDPLLEMIDKNEMAMSAGVELSYLGSRDQAKVYKIVERESTAPSIAQAAKLRKTAENGELDDAMLEYILTSTKQESIKLVIYEDKLRRYFPKSYTKEQIEDTVMKLIQKWHKNREKENER